MSVAKLKALQDDVRRCGRAVVQCTKFLQQGVAAFSHEADIFEETASTIDQILYGGVRVRMGGAMGGAASGSRGRGGL